jgi:hypothetical protein
MVGGEVDVTDYHRVDVMISTTCGEPDEEIGEV